MRYLLAAALLLVASSAYAFEWHDKERTMKLVSSEANGFTLVLKSGSEFKCEITDWPVTEPEGVMGCTNGKTYRFGILNDKQLRFGDKVISK